MYARVHVCTSANPSRILRDTEYLKYEGSSPTRTRHSYTHTCSRRTLLFTRRSDALSATLPTGHSRLTSGRVQDPVYRSDTREIADASERSTRRTRPPSKRHVQGFTSRRSDRRLLNLPSTRPIFVRARIAPGTAILVATLPPSSRRDRSSQPRAIIHKRDLFADLFAR